MSSSDLGVENLRKLGKCGNLTAEFELLDNLLFNPEEAMLNPENSSTVMVPEQVWCTLCGFAG
jgi:hypothetical protein